MKNKNSTNTIHSRIEITDPATLKLFEASRKGTGRKVKTHLEWVIAQWLTQQKPQPEPARLDMDKQAQYNAKDEEYMKALYAQPRDNRKCLELAKELLVIAKGTRLEAKQQGRIERHERHLND